MHRAEALCTWPQVDRKHGHAAAALHASVGVFLLYNVMFNHVLCATTSPGTTLETDPQVCFVD